jgi:DNA topoisomerase-2
MESDDNILNYLDEEGMQIEPDFYAPIIPMVLVNGADGIGTGWSTSVPNFNPHDIISNLRSHIKGEKMKDMFPWYHGYKGAVTRANEKGKYDVCGLIEPRPDLGKATITELPVKKWTQDYREFLEDQMPKGEKKKDGAKLLEDYTEHHTEKTVHFELQLGHTGCELKDIISFEKAFRLRSSLTINNMMLFDASGKIKKYDTPNEIISDFASTRMTLYEKRKEYLLNRLIRECAILSAKMRFIKLVISGELKIKRRKIRDLCQELRKRGFIAVREMPGTPAKGSDKGGGNDAEQDGAEKDEDQDGDDNEDDDAGEEGEGEGDAAAAKRAMKKDVADFEYLVGMPISTLTFERIAELSKLHDSKQVELTALKKKTPSQLWLDDLDQLEGALKERDAKWEQEEKTEKAKILAAKAKQEKQAAAAGSRGAKRASSEPPARGASRPKKGATQDLEAPSSSAAARGNKRKAA